MGPKHHTLLTPLRAVGPYGSSINLHQVSHRVAARSARSAESRSVVRGGVEGKGRRTTDGQIKSWQERHLRGAAISHIEADGRCLLRQDSGRDEESKRNVVRN